MSAADTVEDNFLDEVATLVANEPELSPLDAGVLVALAHGMARDTRAFAKSFGVAHALVLRAASELETRFGLITATDRNQRTQRRQMALSTAGMRLLGVLHGGGTSPA